jgi:hypothetical protein
MELTFGRTILKYILKIQGKRLWPRFVWLKDRDKLWVVVNMVISLHIV